MLTVIIQMEIWGEIETANMKDGGYLQKKNKSSRNTRNTGSWGRMELSFLLWGSCGFYQSFQDNVFHPGKWCEMNLDLFGVRQNVPKLWISNLGLSFFYGSSGSQV